MIEKLTQDDFNAVYHITNSYPKIVYWILGAPVLYNGIMITANILQRKMDENQEWVYIPSIKLTASILNMGDEYEQLVRVDSDDKEITLQEAQTFDLAIDMIYAKLDDIQNKYISINTVDYGEDKEWNGWKDFGNQHIDF